MESNCVFCDQDGLRAGAVLLLEDEHCMFFNSETLEGGPSPRQWGDHPEGSPGDAVSPHARREHLDI